MNLRWPTCGRFLWREKFSIAADETAAGDSTRGGLCKPAVMKKAEAGNTTARWESWPVFVFGCKLPNSKKKIRHLYVDLNLDEIKNTLHSLLVNCETDLMNLIGM